MVNIQLPVSTLESDLADRVEWVHCNMYGTRNPFRIDVSFSPLFRSASEIGYPSTTTNLTTFTYKGLRSASRRTRFGTFYDSRLPLY